MKRIAEARQTIVRVEVILKPVEVQVPAPAIPVEVRNVAVARAIAP